MPDTVDKPTVVHIISVSYSGSTWLNLLLGSHSRAFSIGEGKTIVTHGKAVCTAHGEACPFWSRFDAASGENPVLQIQRLAGKPYLVLNNTRKFLPFVEGVADTRYIHLMRDGRAVTASMMRKLGHKNMWKAAYTFAKAVRRDERLLRQQPPANVLRVIYEKLVDDTPGELRRICEFVGLPFEEGMLEFWNAEHHFLGGNRGTLFSMLRKRDPLAPEKVVPSNKADANWDLDHYKKTDLSKFKDERWKKELTPNQLRVFRLVAGRVNGRYGYSTAV